MRRKILFWSVAAAVLLATIGAVATRGGRESKAPPVLRPDFDVGIPTAQEVRAMLGAYGQRVESNERDLAQLRTELAETRTQLKESVDALGANRRQDAGMLEELLREIRGQKGKPESGKSVRFRTFEFEKESRRALSVPAGSFGEATLLTGVYAPTSGDSLPVLLRLDAALTGPNRSRVPIRGAFLVGKAAGDANSRRAVVQLETLSVVLDSGETAETKVNGWVIDDDGIQGLAGSYVWRAEEILALAGASAGMSAAADAMSARESSAQIGPLGTVAQTITGDPLRFVGNRALGSALGKMSEVISARLQEITPAIYVTNGRPVTIAFVSGAAVGGKRE